ncbi:MAG TPA: UDP-glucose 4-epimerase GalE [Terriglobales bacterium]|nr:UDP-glucose 4-epimerase GalE [Terriglobales bacterium]
MANILVTGGAGYVGSVCCSRLLSAGHSVHVVDDLSGGHRHAVPAGALLHEMHIADSPRLTALLQQHKFDSVFHFAGRIQVGESMTDPGLYFRENVAAGISLLEVLRAQKVTNFVFSSTAAVYDIADVATLSEDDPKQPVNAYGVTKLMFERVLEWYAEAYGWSVTAFRYFNAAGASGDHGEMHQPETHLIPLLLEAAMGRRENILIYGDDYATPDGTCLRDYVHVLDIADAHLLASAHFGKPGMRAYNIGTGKAHSVKEVANAVEEVTGKKLPIKIGPRRDGDPEVLCANPSKLKKELGWAPRHSELKTIVSSAWEFAQKHFTTREDPAHAR